MTSKTNFNLVDSTKLQYHPIRVAQTLQADTWQKAKEVYPIYVEVSPLSICNHACSFCAVDYMRGTDKLDANIYAERIKEMAELGIESIMFAGEGEPLLHKEINEMIASTNAAGIDVAVTSNGVPMTEKFSTLSLHKLSWIKISFNAGTKETYAKIHKTQERDFDIVCNNIARAVLYKRSKGLAVDIGMQMVLLDENAHEVEDFVKLAKSLGVDYAVIKRYSQHKFSDTHQYENTDYTKYLELEKVVASYNSGTFNVVFRSNTMVESDPYETCMSTPNLWAYIDSKNDVYACSAYLGQDRFNMGNLNSQTFKKVWQGLKRKMLFESGIDISECRTNCRMDACNKYLDAVTNNKISNVNFI